MTLYNIQISGRQYHVEIQGGQVRLNGRQVITRLLTLDHPNLFCLTHGGHQRNMYMQHQHNGTYAVTTEGRQMVAEVKVAQKNLQEGSSPGATTGNDLKAPMPGVVLHVHVTDGERVSAGQLLLTLESMKMQMEFRSPREGKVTRVAAQAGQKVEKETLLVTLENETPEADI
jgi:biotin carboxyl carrier protein